LKIMAEPNAAHTCRGDGQILLAQFVRHAGLPPRRLLNGHLYDGLLDFWRYPVLEERFLP
jgi:hypothetical protein